MFVCLSFLTIKRIYNYRLNHVSNFSFKFLAFHLNALRIKRPGKQSIPNGNKKTVGPTRRYFYFSQAMKN